MSTIKNFHLISFILFGIISITYLLATLLAKNSMWIEGAGVIQRTLQLPFIITALAYCTASLIKPLATDEKKHTILIGIVTTVNVFILIGILFLHFTATK